VVPYYTFHAPKPHFNNTILHNISSTCDNVILTAPNSIPSTTFINESILHLFAHSRGVKLEENKKYYPLLCDAVLFGISYQYLRNRLSTHARPSAGGSVSPKYGCLSTKLHGITQQMSVIFTVTASHLKMQWDVTMSLGKLFLTSQRILVASKQELFAQLHTVTSHTTCILSSTAVRTSNLTHWELVRF
jgi:hypothetical protein